MSSGYFSSLQECQKLATDAQEFLQQTGDQLRQSFEVYQGVEDGIAQGLGRTGKGLGGGR